MLTIIHGENQFASRKELEHLKRNHNGEEIVTLNGASLSLTDLIQALEAKSLFGVEKLVIIENLLSQKASGNDKLLGNLRKLPSDVNCVLWEGKEIRMTLLSQFSKAQIFLYKIEKQLFRFLDSLKTGNAKRSLLLFHNALEHDEPETILFMLVRQLRHLLLVKTQSTFLDSMSPWQEQKACLQVENFTLEKLKKAYGDLINIDYSIKSGESALDLVGRLDMFLLNL